MQKPGTFKEDFPREKRVRLGPQDFIEPGQFADSGAIGELVCPACGCPHTHADEAGTYIKANDRHDAAWGGRGGLVIVPVTCESGCQWEICIGQHKGTTYMFATVLKIGPAKRWDE